MVPASSRGDVGGGRCRGELLSWRNISNLV
uniref:Uncharacterized protein n=1 Tax=Anguilla anguilla TaxID=7936 RepID=A0A0E9PFT8_ANGAN